MWVIAFIFFLILWMVGLLYLCYAVYFRLSRKEAFVPFVPADRKGIDAMCDAVALQGSEKVVDIGSGLGHIVFHLLDRYPKIDVTGIELNPMLHLLSYLRQKIFYGKRKLKLYRGDAGLFTYMEYDVVFIFMLSSFVNKVLVPKLETELRVGAKVVSYVFQMKSNKFKETKIALPAHGWKSTVYVYEKVA